MRGVHSRKSVIVTTVVSLVVLLVLNVFLCVNWHDPMSYPTGDGARYATTVHDPTYVRQNPYVYRRMTPFIVRTLTHHTNWGENFDWGVVTVIGQTLAQWLFFLMCWRTFRLGRFMSVLGTLFLATTYWYTAFTYQSIWLVDPLTNVFMVGGLWLLFARRYGWFVVLVLIGMTNKESVLFLAPLYPLFEIMRYRRWRAPQIWRAIGALLIVVAGYIVFQQYVLRHIGADTTNPLAGVQGTFVENVKFISNASHHTLDQFYGGWFTVFYALWFVAIYAWYLAWRRDGMLDRVTVTGMYLLAIMTLTTFLVVDMPRAFSVLAPIIILTSTILLASVRDSHRHYSIVLLFVYAASNLEWIKDPALLLAANGLMLYVLLPELSMPTHSSHVGKVIAY